MGDRLASIDTLPSRPAPSAVLRAVRIWLLAVAGLVFVMVLVGGATRLTESGLSITRWKPVTGVLPPLSADDWREEFDRYRQIPQFAALNPDMTLAGFRTIFWWEWSHRLLARVVGLVYVLPALWFWLRGAFRGALGRRVALMTALLALEPVVGWWMVSSGLADRVEVAQERLALHLLIAAGVFGTAIYAAVGLIGPAGGVDRRPALDGRRAPGAETPPLPSAAPSRQQTLRSTDGVPGPPVGAGQGGGSREPLSLARADADVEARPTPPARRVLAWARASAAREEEEECGADCLLCGKAVGRAALAVAPREPAPRGFALAAAAFALLVYAQLGLGALVAGLRAGRVYDTWPLMGDSFVPAEAFATARAPFDDAATAQFDHRLVAYAVLAFALVQAVAAVRTGLPGLSRRTVALAAVAALQVALGVATLLFRVPIPLALAHQAVALVLFGLACGHWSATGSVAGRAPKPVERRAS